ncbi:MAG: amino acid permease [Actinomycetota bacterium]
MLILVLAANTSFADFPRLASFHAHDHFLPRQLTRFGDRLVFSNGIIVLAGLASLLVIAFAASVTRLIPLYAIGVFTSFTFSQAGMAVRHRRLRERGWRKGIAINGTGAVVSGTMTVIIAATKLADGAWLILVAGPLMLFGLLRVNKHYRESESILKDPERRPPGDIPRQRVIVPVGHADRVDRYALAYAQRVFPTQVTAVHFSAAGATGDWFLGEDVAGESRELRRGTGDLTADLCTYVRKVRGAVGPGELLKSSSPRR